MGSRLLPVCLAGGALGLDAAGLHRVAYYVVLLTVVGAAAAAFVAVADLLEGRGAFLRAATTVLALALVLLGSAVRAGAPAGAAVPVLALSAVVAALVCYGLPILGWLARPAPARARVERQAPQPVSP
jgi:uncharacterized membrane protein